MQLHEKDLAMSPNFRVFWKTITYLTPINPLKVLFSMFTNSKVATESYSIKQEFRCYQNPWKIHFLELLIKLQAEGLQP